MPLNPMIPLAAHGEYLPVGDTLEQNERIRAMKQDTANKQFSLESAQQQQQQQQQLQSLGGQYDLGTAEGQQGYLKAYSAIDAPGAIDLGGKIAQLEESKAKAKAQQDETFQTGLYSITDAFDQALAKNGGDPIAASKDTTPVYQSVARSFSAGGNPLLTPEQLKNLPPEFNQQVYNQILGLQRASPAGLKMHMERLKDRTAEQKNYDQTKADPNFGKFLTDQKTAAAQFRIDNPTDPTAIAFANFTRANPGATPEQQQNFLRNMHQPRSAPAAALAQFIEENPNASADDITSFNADFKSRQKATSDFATGKQGQALNSFNVATEHLDTVVELANALNNGDIRIFNSIANRYAEETGDAAPVNFESAKHIVGAELVKAVVAASGGVAERQQAADIIGRANSPAQLKGAVHTVTELIQGQLKGLRQQYEQTTGRKDFEERLSPKARALFAVGEPKPKNGPSKITSDADYEALPSGAEFIAPDGSHRRKP